VRLASRSPALAAAAAIAVLAAAGPPVAAQEAPPAAELEAEVEAMSPDQLEQCVFGGDRERRCAAAWEAMDRGCLDPDVWIRLLETRFGSREELEEARYLAAYALARSGALECVPHLEALLEDPPRVKSADPDDPEETPAYPYHYAAATGLSLLAWPATMQRLRDHLAPLSPDEQADALARFVVEGEESYARFAVPYGQAVGGSLWLRGLAGMAADLGPTGAWGFARAIERTVEEGCDPSALSKLCWHLADVCAPGWDEVEIPADLQAARERLWEERPGEDALAAYRRHRRVLGRIRTLRRAALEPEVGPAVSAAVRALLTPGAIETALERSRELERPGRREWGARPGVLLEGLRDGPFRMAVEFERDDLVPDLRAFADRYDAFVPDERDFAWLAMRCLHELGTPAAVDYLLAREDGKGIPAGRLSSYGRPTLDAETLAPRIVQILEEEQDRPWGPRFLRTATAVGGGVYAHLVEPERVERVLEHVRGVLADLDAEEPVPFETSKRRRRTRASIRYLERSIARIRAARAEGGGQ